MCVHVKKWRKDAQPEWPEAPSDTQLIATTGDVRGRAATQSFPDTGRTGADGVSRGDFAGLDNTRLPSDGRHRSSDAIRQPNDAIRRPGDGIRQPNDAIGRPGDGTQILSGGPGPVSEHDRSFDLRDPWEPAGESAQAHDPYEVTVQLDSVSAQDTRLHAAEGAPGGGSDSSDGPVFVDESGRRSRRFRRLGIAVGIACAVYAVVIVVTLLSGSSDAPWLPVPGQKNDKPASQVDPTSRPAHSALPSGTGAGDAPAGSLPTASDGSTPSAHKSGASAAASADPAAPGKSAGPNPTPTKTRSNPGPGVGNPKPTTSVGPTTPASPDPTPSESSVAPTEPTSSGTAPAPGAVADGPASPSPVAEESGPPVASPVPSPENHL